MASGMKTQGTELFKVDTSTTSVKIGNIQQFQPPDPSADEIEITDMSSTSKEFVQGLRDFGEAQFEIVFDAATISSPSPYHQNLIADFNAGTIRQWLVGLSDGTASPPTVTASAFGTPATSRTWILFTGFVKSFQLKGNRNDVLRGTLVVRNTSTPTYYYKP